MILFDRKIIEDRLVPNLTRPVAHYTRIGTLRHFLPAGSTGWSSAHATPVQFLNDRKELALGLEILKEVSTKSPTYGTRLRSLIDYLIDSFGAKRRTRTS